MNEENTHQGYARIIRYIGLSFLSMLVILMLVSLFFYNQTREIQAKYSQEIQDTYRRIELVGGLFENKERSQSLIRAHIGAPDKVTKDSIARELREAYRQHEVLLLKLQQVLEMPGQLQQLQKLNDNLKNQHSHLDSLLALSNAQQREKAMTYSSAHLAPFYIRHQAHLISLNKELNTSAQAYTRTLFPAFSSLLGEYVLLLVVVVPFIMLVIFAFGRITKRLQLENQRLNEEIRERKNLQLQLEQSQAHFRLLFERNPLPLFVYDRQTLRFLEVNEAAVLEYGYTAEEFLHMSVLDILPKEESMQARQDSAQRDKSAEVLGQHHQHRRKDGSLFKVRIKSLFIAGKDGTSPCLVTSENVHKQQSFIERLEKSEKQLREVSSSIPGAVYQFRVDAQNNFSFPFLSDGIFNLFGVKPEEAYQDPYLLFEAVHPDALPEVEESIAIATSHFQPWIKDIRIWNKQEEKWTWIRGHGLPSSKKEDGTMLYNGTFIDITNQKEAQERLIASEANLRALLDSSPQAIYLLDKDLNVLLFNAVAADEVRKLTLKELQTGQRILDLTAEDQKDVLLENHALALQGKPTIYETGCGELWFEVSYRPVLTHDKQIIAVALSIHDISEQRNIIAAIRNSEARLARAQQLAQLGNWEYDLQRDSFTISDNLYTIYGISLSYTVTFNSIAAFTHPEDKERVLQDYYQVVVKKETVVTEHRICLQDGTLKYLHQAMEPLVTHEGQVLKVIGTTLDITEQKQKELEVREAKDRFQSTIENIPEIIFSADAALRIFYISPQCRVITGYTEEEFTQEHLWPRIIHEGDLPSLLQKLEQEVPLGRKIQQEMRIIAKDGKEKWVLLRASPMLDREGNVVRIDASLSDVTERKLVEAKRTLLTEQLQVQNQNLQQFAYIVSHNLRAPIANILGLTRVYNRQQPEAPLNRHIVDKLAHSAQHLDHIIRDLNNILTVRGQILDVSEELQFEDLLLDILKSLSGELQRTNAVVEYDFSKAPGTVSLRSYVYSIMQNLLTNAIKYRHPARTPRICIRSYKEKDYICIEISDNGLGIDLAKVRGNLFGLYKRFHPHIEGRGLGLHLVKTQIDLLEGKIEVNSQVGEGTTFKIYI